LSQTIEQSGKGCNSEEACKVSTNRRGAIWWYRFKFAGQTIRETSKSTSRTVAREAERSRRRELEEAYNGISRPKRIHILSVVADSWLKAKATTLSPRTVQIEKLNLKHLNPVLGQRLLCDISADDVVAYQAQRQKEGAAPKTVNLEVGTLRAILRKHRLWANIQPDVKMLRVADDVGRAINGEEETSLLHACRASRSRSLYPAVALALNTCMRYSELRLLRWKQVDLVGHGLTVGKSKTDAVEGRFIPLNSRAVTVLGWWAAQFPNRLPHHCVFPSEHYGAAGDGFTACVYRTDPTRPIGRWKEAWEAAKIRAGVSCRFHDLRHTGCTRMLEAGVPFAVVAELMGWSASTAIRMAKRYGHIGQNARRQAIETLATGYVGEGAQNWAQSKGAAGARVQ